MAVDKLLTRDWKAIDAKKVSSEGSPAHIAYLIEDAIKDIDFLQYELKVAQQRIKDLLQERREAKQGAHRDYYR